MMECSMKFTYQFDQDAVKIEVSLPPEAVLPEVLEAFEKFLVASGYVFDGTLDFVQEESNGVTAENTVA